MNFRLKSLLFGDDCFSIWLFWIKTRNKSKKIWNLQRLDRRLFYIIILKGWWFFLTDFFFVSECFSDCIRFNIDIHINWSLVRNMFSTSLCFNKPKSCSVYRFYMDCSITVWWVFESINSYLFKILFMNYWTDVPEFLVLTTKRKVQLRFGMQLFTQCEATWEKSTEAKFYIIRFVLLYW